MLTTALIVMLAAEPSQLELETELDLLRHEQPSALWYLAPTLLLGLGGATLATIPIRDWTFVSRQPGDFGNRVSLGVGVGTLIFGAVITGVIAYLRSERYARIAELELREEKLQREDDARLELNLPASAARKRIRALQVERPGLGGAAALLAAGVVVGTLSIMTWTVWNGREGALIAIGLTLDLVAAGLAGVGLWQLISRTQRRAEIDLEIRQERDLEAAGP